MDRNSFPDSVDSIEKLDFERQFGFGPQVTSAGLNWTNLFAMIAANPKEVMPPLNVPAIKEDHLVIHLLKPVKLSTKLENRRSSTISIPGTFCLVPQETPSQWQIEGNIATVLVLCIKHEVLTRITSEFFDLDTHFAEVMEKLVVEDPLLHQIGRSIYQELLTPGLASQLFIDSLTQTLVIHLLRKYSVFQREPPKIKGHMPAPMLKSVMDYIHEHLDRNVSLGEIAGIAHLSPFHLARLFKQTLGVTVHQYVLHKRLEVGKELLMKGALTITEVATKTGFVDASHFSRHFKRQFGNPSVFMNNDSKNIHGTSNLIQDN